MFQYVPFTAGDLREKFAFPVPVRFFIVINLGHFLGTFYFDRFCLQWTDKHGKLSLAPKQSSKLVKWAR